MALKLGGYVCDTCNKIATQGESLYNPNTLKCRFTTKKGTKMDFCSSKCAQSYMNSLIASYAPQKRSKRQLKLANKLLREENDILREQLDTLRRQVLKYGY